MPEIVKDTTDMIAGMTPELRDGSYVFAMSDDPALVIQSICTFRETEGLSLILPLNTAQDAGFDCSAPMRCITLNVYSSLEGVGLTAAVATALSNAGIACNMVAAFHHDHAFVPANKAEAAVNILLSLQNGQT
ncbi:MAG: ACT domain-containing protein [Yoonia sp.]